MKNITVIFTVHKDNGIASARVLFEMLDLSKPETIFLEAPEKGFERYTSSPGLENRAIAMLLENYCPKLIPVDNTVPKLEDYHLYNKMFAFLDATSGNIGLKRQNKLAELVSFGGFEYLNSKEYLKAQSELEDHEAKVVEMLGDSEIKSIYRRWRSTNSDREQGMVDRIYSYCRACESINAVYLVGAAHRRGLEEKIRERFHSIPEIEWTIGVNNKWPSCRT